jgi:hypothetical protein
MGMGRERRSIDCGAHGARPMTLVCKHLVGATGAGWHWALHPEDLDGCWPDAWCDRCEAVVAAERGWTERADAAAGFVGVCDVCYETARERNWPATSASRLDVLLADAVPEFERRLAALRQAHRLDDVRHFEWRDKRLVLRGVRDLGLRLTVQMLGSHSRSSNTWLWAWGNEHYEEEDKVASRRVRAYGEEHGVLQLSAAHWGASEQDAWRMTAVALRLLGGLSGYRTPSGSGHAYMIVQAVEGFPSC